MLINEKTQIYVLSLPVNVKDFKCDCLIDHSLRQKKDLMCVMLFFLYYTQEVVSKETIKVLSKGQYCVIKDVVDKHGTPQLGKRELRVGPCSFFLHPGKQNIDTKKYKT